MTTESYIRVEDLEPGIARLTIDRAKALNALNEDVLDQLHDHLQALAKRDDLSALIVTGTGRAFVAGADIKSMLSMDLEQAGAFAHKGHRTFDALAALPFVTIAALNGFTLGGGLELAVSCDLIYASTKAKLGLPEVGLGLIPGFGGTQRLGRLVGYHVARELIFTGRTISAKQALYYGIALSLFEPEELEEGVMGVAREIASKGPRAVATAKRIMAQTSHLPVSEGLAVEKQAFEGLFNHSESKEGMQAFVDKRPARFRGDA